MFDLPSLPRRMLTIPIRPDDAEIAQMFGELVITNIHRGADIRTVEEWARYAGRYGLLALKTQAVIDPLADPNAAHRYEQEKEAHTADVLAWYR